MKRRKKAQLDLFENKKTAKAGRPRATKHNAATKRHRKRTGHGKAARARPTAKRAATKRVKVAGYSVKAYTRRKPVKRRK